MFNNEYSLIYLLKIIYGKILHHLDALLQKTTYLTKPEKGILNVKEFLCILET